MLRAWSQKKNVTSLTGWCTCQRCHVGISNCLSLGKRKKESLVSRQKKKCLQPRSIRQAPTATGTQEGGVERAHHYIRQRHCFLPFPRARDG
jgi:hypothetical protein